MIIYFTNFKYLYINKVVRLDQTFTYQPNLPSIGPFLENLVKSVDGWLNNSIEVNIALCSILSRLATYSHPLLRSLILNPYLILQPSIPSLAVSIATLKQRIDSALRVHENQEKLIEEARLALQARLSRAALQVTRDGLINPITKGDRITMIVKIGYNIHINSFIFFKF